MRNPVLKVSTLFNNVGLVPFVDEGFKGTIIVVVGATDMGVATTSYCHQEGRYCSNTSNIVIWKKNEYDQWV